MCPADAAGAAAGDVRAEEALLSEVVSRLDTLERRVEGLAVPPISAGPWYRRIAWDQVPSWTQAIATPLMVALVGWWLTGSLEVAIKQQQTDISGVKEMRDSLKDLYAPEPEKAKVETAALSIAAFGGVAAGPLVEAVNRGGAARVVAAEQGLVAAAALDKERVCRVLAAVTASSVKLYTAETKALAKRLHGELRC
jgi:hypothetical protein